MPGPLSLIQACTALSLSLLLGGCGTAVRLQVLEPADILVPARIQTLAVIDRSQPGDLAGNLVGAVEGALTGESIGQDRAGRGEAVRGVVETLGGSPRFKVIQPIADRREVEADIFEPSLGWGAAQRICRRAGCQGILSLEAFDSDSRDTDNVREEEETGDDGKKRLHRYHEVTRDVRVEVAWRLYDTQEARILDFVSGDARDRSASARGDRLEDARLELPDTTDTVRALSLELGTAYGRRIAPTYAYVYRRLYDRGDPRLKTARGYVRAQDWAHAVPIWEEVARDPAPKLRGKALYNLALAKEVEGDLDGALELAVKAAAILDNGRSRGYVEILRGRIADRRRLEKQLEPPTPGPHTPPPPRR